nr:hypothetical protein [Tanacetum cinerariifolium]
PNGEALRKCILSCPYKPTTVLVHAVEATDDSPAVPEHTTDVKTNLFWEFEKFTSHDGESMESYYTKFDKLMNEMIRNNLTVTTTQVKENKEKDKIGIKPNKIKIKREAWKSPAMSKSSHNQESRKREENTN